MYTYVPTTVHQDGDLLICEKKTTYLQYLKYISVTIIYSKGYEYTNI